MVPKKKTSATRTRTRRSHHKIKPVNYSVCKRCDNAKLSHSACPNCGYLNSKITVELSNEEDE